MLRSASRIASAASRRAAAPLRPVGARGLAGHHDNDSDPVTTVDRLVYRTNKIENWELKDYVEPEPEYTKDGAIVVNNVAFSLEWVLSSPPPLHAFIESPTMVEWPKDE